MSLKLPTVKVRTRAVAGGAVLGGVLLVGMALTGGVDDTPGGSSAPAPERLGPATAIQPELREALLTDEDLPPAPPTDRRSPPPESPAGRPGAAAPPPPAARPADPETGALTDLCRALFENPAGLRALWQTPPEEVTASSTSRPSGATLHQVLSVFDADRSVEAYRRLREATSCSRFESALADGTPVTVLLRELTARRPESAPADDSYTMLITLEDGGMAGWLTVDRFGPIVSVLHQLGPAEADQESEQGYEELAQARYAALNKLRPLLRSIRQGAG